MVAKTEDLARMMTPWVEQCGCVLWGLEFHTQGKYSILRIYIEKSDLSYVGVEDCRQVSQVVSEALDAADPIKPQYTLEVSSPGMDRRLFTLAQCARYVGQWVQVELASALDGQRRFKGLLSAVTGDQLSLECEQRLIPILFDRVSKMHLYPKDF